MWKNSIKYWMSFKNKASTGTVTRQILPLILLIIALCFFPACSQTSSTPTDTPKAAIIDQLYSLQPNEVFTSQVTQELEDYGFEVDIYKGDEVTVNLYRQLPGHGYKLIIFRAHSGLLGREGKTIKRTCLFTNEPYSQTKHVTEQLSDQLAMARIDEHHPWVFGIGDEFITQSMEGKFNNTAIIMMGCSCLYLDDLAQAFIDKGASAYLGWNATVDLDYVDEATINLVQNLCTKKLTLRKAVTKTMAEKGLDPHYKASLNYYPPQSGSHTILVVSSR